MDTNVTPKISVIMAAYNAERYIREAVESVIGQTFKDWQLFIVNDCSTDGTEKILETFTDPRITILKNERNLGSVVSRNIAFARIQSEYVAILDADDIAMPDRFAEQVRFLDVHPDFGLVGSWTKVIAEDGTQIGRIAKDRTSAEKIPVKLLFHNVMAFSSVMMRKSAMPPTPFDDKTMPVEDVALYLQMLPHSKFAIMPKVLVSYRSHEKGISKVYGGKRQEVMDRLITTQLQNLGITPSAEELKIHRTNYGYAGENVEEFLHARESWLLKLIEKNREANVYPTALFEEVVAEKWLESCDANARLGFTVWKLWRNSPLSRKITWRQNAKKLIRLAIKCLLSKDTL